MKKAIRVLSLALAFLFVMGMLPLGQFSMIEEVEAASTITTDEVISIIQKIYDKTNNRYWCENKSEKDMKDAAKREDYSFGTSASCKCNHNNGVCKSNHMSATQCQGFANFVDFCIFGKSPQSAIYHGNEYKYSGKKVSKTDIYTIQNEKRFEKFEEIKPGDILCFNNHGKKGKPNNDYPKHKVVVWKVTREGGAITEIKFIECNVGGNCHIQSRSMSASEMKERMKHSASFIIQCPAISCNHSNIDSFGNCTNPNCSAHFHQYNSNGVCMYCEANGKASSYKDRAGQTAYYYDDANKGNYLIQAEAKGSEKYGTVEKKQWSLLPFTVYSNMAGSQRAGTASSGEIISVYKNHKDYLENKDTDKVWYGLRVSGISGTVYVQGDSVDAKMSSKIVITGETYPKARVIEGKNPNGSDQTNYAYTVVKGTITATDSKVDKVVAAVFKEDDFTYHPFELAQLKGEIQERTIISADEIETLCKTIKPQFVGKASNINKPSYKLQEHDNLFDNVMRFKKLEAGYSYIYIIAATDTKGVSTTARHPFYVESSSSAKTTCKLTLSSGEVKEVTVEKGSTYTLPTRYRKDMDFLGWARSDNADVAEFEVGDSYTVTKDTTLYAVFRVQDIDPPAAPVLTAATYDIAVGDTQTISWQKVDGATKYIAFLYDENDLAIDFQSTETNTPSISIPFETAGTYSISVAGMNKAGYGEESTARVTVTVHEDVTATFMNYDGTAWTTYDAVRYGRSATIPADPVREGYTFLGWTDVEGSNIVKENVLAELTENKTFYPVYSAIPYSVTFYNKDGGVLSTQNVTYNGNTPGSATPPQPPAVDGYTFLEWDTQDYMNVRESGIKVHPVYMRNDELAATTMPMSIHIDSVEAEDNGYWVYYSVTNNRDYGQLGRVVLAGKTVYGKFITQTESGAFYIRSRTKSTAPYQGNAYIPVSEADMATLAMMQVYVVDSYQSTRPIALMDEWIIESGMAFGEYSEWLTEEQLAGVSYSRIQETGTQYRYKVKQITTTSDPNCPEGWTLESVNSVDGGWGEWSDWQYEPVTESETRQVNTSVETISEAYTVYRYGRWYGTNVVGKQSGKTFSAAASPSFDHANHNYNNASSKFSKQYTAWGKKRLSAISDTFHTSYHDSDQTWFKISNGQYYWHIYYNGSQTAANKYFWEETDVVAADTRLKYQYRDKNETSTTYTYSAWSDWSVWSSSSETPPGEVEVDTRTVYRVLLTGTNSQGLLHTASVNLGSTAANKQAILTVYKVDSASDYSNQYINQVALDETGSFEFSFYTLEEPTPETGDFTVSLTVEDATEPIYLDPIPVAEDAMRRYTVTFIDEVTGLPFNVQNVIEGRAAVAPEIPNHPEYYFLGWEYGLGNIRENMTIKARFVPKLFTVVFVDAVNATVDMYTDLPFGSQMPQKADPVAEGYRFIGWRANGGPAPETVTGHMIVTAEYDHISYTVSYWGVEPKYENGIEVPLLTQSVFYGEYPSDPFAYEGEYDDFDEDEPDEGDESNAEFISVEDLEIPDSMYFAGWSEGAEDPVMGNISLSPILSYYDDTEEVYTSLDGGIYVGEQSLTLCVDDEGSDSIPVQYRIVTVGANEDDTEWIDYDLSSAPEITITETCILQIEAQENEKNGFNAEYEYVIVSQEELPGTPASMAVAQTGTDGVSVAWSAVEGAMGYLLQRTSDWGETSEFMIEDTSFIDYGVESLRAYSYSVCAYTIAEKNGATMLLNGESTEEQRVFFFGGYTPVSSIEITGSDSVYIGSAVQLSATVSPAAAYDTSVSWTTTNGTGEGYITSEGLFYGTAPGTVTVTARAQDGSEVTASATMLVEAISTGAGNATLLVSSSIVRAGGNANVTVSISEDSFLQSMQFAVVYDSSKLTLVSADSGTVMQNRSPNIGTTEEGVVHFTWLDVESLTDGGSILDLTFKANASATGTALVEIPTDGSQPFVFSQGDSSPIAIASVNGALNILQLLLGDVNESGGVNIVDASLIRRYTVKLVTLTETQLLAADVNGDGEVNVIDAHMIRRYIARLLDAFPAA